MNNNKIIKKYSPQSKNLAVDRAEKDGVAQVARDLGKVFKVSVSGYYAWLKRKPTSRKQRDNYLKNKIKLIFDDEKSRAGAPRITRRLNNEGEPIGKQRVARLMKESGL